MSERGHPNVRHRLATRLWHWVTAAAVIVLFLSGLAIFNAHPRLYWGSYGTYEDPAWLEIGSDEETGYLSLGDARIETTGALGLWYSSEGHMRRTAFPAAVTRPSPFDLAGARNLHLAVSWALIIGWPLFLVLSIANGHLVRDLLPRRDELRPGTLGRTAARYLRLRFRAETGATGYGVLQKLTYLMVLAGLLPAVILSGLAMSPAMDAAWPWLLDLFAGRQSARSVHFICAGLLLLFFIVHLAMVLLSGPFSLIRDMITGGKQEDGT